MQRSCNHDCDRKSICYKSLIAGIGILSLLGYERLKKSEFYKRYYHYISKLENVPLSLDVVNLGSTAAYYAFDYNNLHLAAMNLAGFTQPFQYDLKILKKYEKRVKKKAVVLITFVYPIFLIPDIPLYRKEVYNQFSQILDIKYNSFINQLKNIINCKFPFFLHFYYQSVFNMIELEKRNGKRNHFTNREREEIINKKINNWWKEAEITNYNLMEFGLTEEIKQKMYKSKRYLEQIINFCNKRDWKPVLIVLPYSEKLNKQINENFLKQIFYKNLDLFLNRGIPLLDYSHDKKFSSGELYMDMEYLNEEGRKLFTDTVINDLQKLYL